MLPLTKQEGRSYTVTALAVCTSWRHKLESEGALILIRCCLEYVPGKSSRSAVRFRTPWGPPWTDEVRLAQHPGTHLAPFQAIQSSAEHVLQRISKQLPSIAIRFRWADYDKALDESHAGQLVFEHGREELSESWERPMDRMLDGPSYHWATCRDEGCPGCCADDDSSAAALRGQLRSRYWGPFQDLQQVLP